MVLINRLPIIEIWITTLIPPKLCHSHEYCSLLISCYFYVLQWSGNTLYLLNESTLFSLEDHFYIHQITIVTWVSRGIIIHRWFSIKFPLIVKIEQFFMIYICTLLVSFILWWKVWKALVASELRMIKEKQYCYLQIIILYNTFHTCLKYSKHSFWIVD